MGLRGTGRAGFARTQGGGYQQPTYAPGASYAPKISMGRPGTAMPAMGGSQNFSIKAASNGDYVNNFASGDVVCNREFFTMTEDRPIVKEVGLSCCCDALVVGTMALCCCCCRRDAMLILFCRNIALLPCRSMRLLLKCKCVVLLLCYGVAVLLLPHVPCCI